MAFRSAAALACMAASSAVMASAQTSRPLELMGVRIGETTDQVRRVLEPRASFDKEVEGQQIWRVLHDPSLQYVFVGFDGEKHVRYVTTVAAVNGPPMACSPLGDVASAVRKGDARFVEYRREIKQEEETVAVIAKGSSADHLSRCSIKKEGASAEEEEEQRERTKRK